MSKNAERADRGRLIFDEHRLACGADLESDQDILDDDFPLRDLLTDLLHMVDDINKDRAPDKRIDFDTELQWAREHHEHEVKHPNE